MDKGRPHDEGFRPRYWFINGRGFPDTAAPNFADWLPSQPYGSSLHVLPIWTPAHHGGAGSPGGYDTLPAVVRYINASETAHPFHPHSADTLVHGIDGRPLESSTGVDLTENHYSIEIAPGQTMDATWSYEYVGTHTAAGVNVPFSPASNPVPVPVQDFRDTRWTPATYASGTPYLGIQDDLPDGITTLNECGEYYSVSHSHAVEEATTYGAAGGGMLTLYRIDPPGDGGAPRNGPPDLQPPRGRRDHDPNGTAPSDRRRCGCGRARRGPGRPGRDARPDACPNLRAQRHGAAVRRLRQRLQRHAPGHRNARADVAVHRRRWPGALAAGRDAG